VDHIVGVLNVKRLLPLLHSTSPSAETKSFDVRAMMDTVMAVPETASAMAVLTRLRETHTQLVVVIDEYGGTAGIVTLVDLVENLVGEIEDELHPVVVKPAATADGSFELDGLTTLVEAKEFHGLDLTEEELDIETVGGYVFSRLGRPAVIGDEIRAPDNRMLRVSELDGLRIARVRVLPPQAPPTLADESERGGHAEEMGVSNGRVSTVSG
jgi:CBS domain containing-hemolysin-like protein